MFITRECDYAVRVVRALQGGKKFSVNEICEGEDITAPFAYKILKKLQKAGIVRGYRGAKGGYTLRKPLKELTLLDIYQAIDPEMYIIECTDPNYLCMKNGSICDECEIRTELLSIQNEIMCLLKRKNMEELLEKHG